MSTQTTYTDAFLGFGVELLMLGLAVGVAGISDETGTIMVVFMLGLALLWLIYHTTVTGAIPKLLTFANQGVTVTK